MDFEGGGVEAKPAMPRLVVAANRARHAVYLTEGCAIQFIEVAVERNDDGVALALHTRGGEVS